LQPGHGYKQKGKHHEGNKKIECIGNGSRFDDIGFLCGEKAGYSPCPSASQTPPPPIIKVPVASPPPQQISAQPLLRINTPMHTASIRRISNRRISTDKGGRWVVSASNDKSIRIWDGVTGKWINTLHPIPISRLP
jgi:WD40 repeat protein